MSLFFEVPGEPVGKARARTFYDPRVRRTISKTPAKTKAYEEGVRLAFYRAHSSHEPLTGPVSVEVYAFFAIPPSWSKKKREAALAGNVPHTTRLDADNILKIIGDALNGVVFHDDSQITDASVQKRYASRPRVEVNITSGR